MTFHIIKIKSHVRLSNLPVHPVVMTHLDVSSIETVLLAVPDEQYSQEKVAPLWECMEEMVTRERVYTLGMSDLSRTQLEELYTTAKVATLNIYWCIPSDCP